MFDYFVFLSPLAKDVYHCENFSIVINITKEIIMNSIRSTRYMIPYILSLSASNMLNMSSTLSQASGATIRANEASYKCSINTCIVKRVICREVNILF